MSCDESKPENRIVHAELILDEHDIQRLRRLAWSLDHDLGRMRCLGWKRDVADLSHLLSTILAQVPDPHQELWDKLRRIAAAEAGGGCDVQRTD